MKPIFILSKHSVYVKSSGAGGFYKDAEAAGDERYLKGEHQRSGPFRESNTAQS